ncbi:MAG TPA: BON domain-containing protein [Usitatibacter sp.]|nr:BON domain-containing protein [Usitatibacter sp.]
MKTNSPTLLLAALPLALALGACSPDKTNNPTVGANSSTSDTSTSSSVTTNATSADTSSSTMGQKVDNAVANAKTDIASASDQTGKTLDDAAITASVKTDILKDADLSVLKIDVDTKDGVVTLNGLANTEDAKTRATRLASGVKGVKEVHNNLTVKPA